MNTGYREHWTLTEPHHVPNEFSPRLQKKNHLNTNRLLLRLVICNFPSVFRPKFAGLHLLICHPGRTDSIVAGYVLGDRGLIPYRGGGSSPTLCAQPALGQTQPSVQWVPGGCFVGGKVRPGRGADHSPLRSAELKKKRASISSLLKRLSWLVAGQIYFTLHHSVSSCTT
jgi:hypothetical protein